MPDAPTAPTEADALAALADWWTAMGVSVDADVLSAPPPVTREAVRGLEPAPRVQKRIAQAPKHSDLAAWIETARHAAAEASSIEALKSAIEAFEGSPLKEGTEHTVVFDGVPGARLMVIGEGPGAEEDRTGLPFVGRTGQLLDRMLASIGRKRAENAFITNVNYWRPPANRNPDADELAVCRPFVDRMIELSAPKLIIAAGGVSAVNLLASADGIMKLRGREFTYTTPGGFTCPLIPILHPAYLLRRPQDKSRAWRDLLLIEKRMTELEVS